MIAKNKLGFVIGSYSKPDSDSDLLPLWERCNSMVISWILDSVNDGIGVSIPYYPIAETMWAELNLRFRQSDGTKIFQLQKDLNTLSRGNLSVSSYLLILPNVKGFGMNII